jgi:hypothetical protein
MVCYWNLGGFLPENYVWFFGQRKNKLASLVIIEISAFNQHYFAALRMLLYLQTGIRAADAGRT